MCSSGDWGCSPTSSFAAGRAVKKKQCAHGHPACENAPGIYRCPACYDYPEFGTVVPSRKPNRDGEIILSYAGYALDEVLHRNKDRVLKTRPKLKDLLDAERE